MKKITGPLLFFILVFLSYNIVFAANSNSIIISPSNVIQGEPVLVRIDGAADIASVRSVIFDGAVAGVFMYHGKPATLLGIDLNKKPGSYELIAKFFGGEVEKKIVDVGARQKIVAPLGIPEKLGGNTPTSQKALVNTLAMENASLANIYTGKKAFWTEKFLWPLKDIAVTDPYGYTRQTGAYSIAHKGTDFRAAEGTPVMVINRGVVRIVKTYREYGKTIVVDHGLGLMSFYMHLSKIKVNAGELVARGQVIGLSGQTGYAESPHLHLTVRVNGNSIDPINFFALFP